MRLEGLLCGFSVSCLAESLQTTEVAATAIEQTTPKAEKNMFFLAKTMVFRRFVLYGVFFYDRVDSKNTTKTMIFSNK